MELIKRYDLIIHYHPGKANIVADVLSQKSGGSLAVLITQQPKLLKELEGMQLEVRIKKPGEVTSRVNQVSVQYDLYERIKEAQ